MGVDRRDFIRLAGAGLAAAGLNPRLLFSGSIPQAGERSPLRDQLLNEEYPFPYDEAYFECAERIYNLRRTQPGSASWKTNLSLILKSGKTLDVKVLASDRPETLPTTNIVYSFSGAKDILDLVLEGGDGPRLFYQVLYREGSAGWKALSPKSFKLPNLSLASGGKVSVIFISDDHTFDDADYWVPEECRAVKLSGDYVNIFMKGLRNDPNWWGNEPVTALKNGFTLAQALRYILASEDPDFVVNLGDTNGIGANYKWEGLGLPTKNLTDADYNNISRILWLRMRKMYSAISPSVPFYMAFGNHDGEEKWNSLRFRAKEWRQKLFTFPDPSTYPEGGHPDGNYYGFTWGADAQNRGGAQFLFLDVCAFCERAPRTPDEWTLGRDQLSWLENVLKKGEKEFVFACFHHVLGGWPAGPGEDRTDIAYGRGPLFAAADYQSFIDPAKIEQVIITDLGKKYGLNAFMYGHDHIFHVHDVGKGETGKDLLGVCAGSTKYMGEDVWWKGPLWMKYYGDAFKSKPDFWGPSGVTRLTVQNHQAKIDYLVTGTTPHSNIPYGERFGTVLSTRSFVSPTPTLKVDRTSLAFQGVEGGANPAAQVLGVRNAGTRAMNYQLKSDRGWLSASPGSGTSWGETDEISISLNLSGMDEGTYGGSVTVESPGTAGSPQKVDVALKIDPPPIYPPLSFSGVRHVNRGLFWRESVIVLTWESNPLNRNIQKYKLAVLDASGSYVTIAEIAAGTSRYVFRKALPNKPYSFAVKAVDSKNREGEPAFVQVS